QTCALPIWETSASSPPSASSSLPLAYFFSIIIPCFAPLSQRKFFLLSGPLRRKKTGRSGRSFRSVFPSQPDQHPAPDGGGQGGPRRPPHGAGQAEEREPLQPPVPGPVSLQIAVRRLTGLADHLVGADPLPGESLLLHNKNGLLK